jgi:NAD(P)-dependent dehydrogenase (short-subunit alcohol dehydrogenase family)
MVGPLAERSAIITGANQGLGREIARHYILAGANVLLCARNEGLLAEARGELAALAAPGQQVLAQPADVSLPGEGEALVKTALEAFGGVEILVNNAGVQGAKGGVEVAAWAEWIRTIEINLFGSVLLCRAVLPHFRARGYGKIVQLSGGGATNPMPYLSAYAVSKAGIVRFVETLAEEVRGTGIDVNALAPGALNTRMLEEVLEAGPEKVGQAAYERALKQKAAGGARPARAAELAVFLGGAASDGITGKLVSALWDNWERWPEHGGELAGSDVYTLRRITGRDRGMEWGDK